MDFQRHALKITRGGDTTDGLGRTTATGSSVTIYSGTAEVQEGEVRKATEEGNAVRIGGAEAWLPDGESVTRLGIQQGDAAKVTRPDGTTIDTTVAITKPVDNSLVLSTDRAT